jgi:hypothetical protein
MKLAAYVPGLDLDALNRADIRELLAPFPNRAQKMFHPKQSSRAIWLPKAE